MWATRMPEMAGGADRGAGTASKERLMCLPAVVTPTRVVCFTNAMGLFFFARGAQMRIAVPTVAQDLAEAAALGI